MSLALVSRILEGKERMHKYTIAKITIFRGYVDKWKVAKLLKTMLEEQWKWDARPLKDGRYLIECPSAATARQMEKEGPMESLAFTLAFISWTIDLYHPAKAEGTLWWMKIKNLPMFYWDQDTVTTMLKSGRDLIQEEVMVLAQKTSGCSSACGSHGCCPMRFTVTLPHRDGAIPATIDVGLSSTTEHKAASMTSNNKMEEPPAVVHGSPPKPPPNRDNKGKAPISFLQDAPAPGGAGHGGWIGGPHSSMCGAREQPSPHGLQTQAPLSKRPPPHVEHSPEMQAQKTMPPVAGPNHGAGSTPSEAQALVPLNPANINVIANVPNQSNSPMRHSHYIKALYNPSEENIKAINQGIVIDLSKAALKKIGNTWNLITDEAWGIITSGQMTKDTSP
ncbi:hypothetical protein J5N97_022293 [Dioscorea zingiberensis]|uniref:DUF4283 domain-containing protein n=1 Tax=Dioscorea zingiberensis TaxID=325984 RepID=A0A9D5CAA7_9LILI|nr:hypothetical protein J5N97_022293 [Dioscorea zingiberensis]